MAIRPFPPPERGIVRPHAVQRPFTVTRWATDGPLAELVAYYWQVTWTVPDGDCFVQHTLADPVTHVVFEDGLGELVGPQSQRFRRELRGRSGVLGVALRPGVLRAWWPGSVWELRNQRVPVEQLWGEPAVALGEALGRIRPGPEQPALLDTTLQALPVPALSPELCSLRDLVHRIQTERALVSVAQIAALAGMSTRTLQRRFKQHVGFSPAEVLRRRRIQDAMTALDADPERILSDLAYALGYCDQAHFTRDFRAMTGMPPRVYVDR